MTGFPPRFETNPWRRQMADGSGIMSLMRVNAAKGRQRAVQLSKQRSQQTSQSLEGKSAEAMNKVAEKNRQTVEAAYKVTIRKADQALTKPAFPNISPALQEYMRILNF